MEKMLPIHDQELEERPQSNPRPKTALSLALKRREERRDRYERKKNARKYKLKRKYIK